MQHLGRNHPYLTLAMAPELLSTHPYFESLEPDVDDPACILLLPCVGGGGGGNCTPTIGMGGDQLLLHTSCLNWEYM